MPGACAAGLRALRVLLGVVHPDDLPASCHWQLEMDSMVCTLHIGYVARAQCGLQFVDAFEQIASFAHRVAIDVDKAEVVDLPRPGQR